MNIEYSFENLRSKVVKCRSIFQFQRLQIKVSSVLNKVPCHEDFVEWKYRSMDY